MKVIIYKDERGEWRWRVRAKNGNILADSGEGYATKSSCRRAWKSFATKISWSKKQLED
jgi:uncharacterized protein YegP (UPF0339 family)